MDVNKILKSDYLDILFEGRNKNYGGYELRKQYPNRMRNAALATVGAIILIAAGPVIASKFSSTVKTKPVANLKEVTLAEPPPMDPKKPPPPPPPPAPPPPVKPTVKFTPPVIKKDQEVKEEEKPPEQKDMKEAPPGPKTEAGDPNGIDPGIVDKPGTGPAGPVEAPEPPKIFTYVEQMPQFNGNVQQWIADHAHFDQAKEAGVDGKVYVKFVVNEDGDISDVSVIRDFGYGSKEEAMRVVKSMPRWTPGKQNGRAVKVYYTLPITFKLE